MPQPLTITEIKELLKQQHQGRASVGKAIEHEGRLRLHSALALSGSDGGVQTALTGFLRWVEDTLQKPDKFDMFCQLLRFPVPTVSLTSEIFSALEKVYDGRDPVFQYDFLAPEVEQDWQEYRREAKLPEFFRRKVWDTFKERLNSLVVVDLPAEQDGDYPTPYAYCLNIESVHDFELDDSGFRWVAFKQGEERMAWFDQTHYRLFSVKGDEIQEVLAEVEHGLGYTPVFFLWDDAATQDTPAVKASPLSEYLGDLDWLLFHQISKRHLDMYASYPVYWGFEIDCEYEHPQGHERCRDGWLVDAGGNYVINRGTKKMLTPCPACGNKRIVGAGSFVQVQVPDAENGIGDMRNPVGVVPAESTSLEYNVKETQRLERKVYEGVVGYGGEPLNDRAVNEKQVRAAFDSKAAMLKNLKTNLEKLQKNVEETICRLRYGSKVFKGATINYGTSFHLATPEDLLAIYEKSRKEGAPMPVLDALQEDYIVARYRHDPLKLQREMILLHLDPFRHRTADEVKGYPVNPEELYLKFNFSTLIARFEREQANLIDFGSALPFDTKIERIKQILLDYATTTQTSTEGGNADNTNAAAGANTGANTGNGSNAGANAEGVKT
jgi:hypothetical protein